MKTYDFTLPASRPQESRRRSSSDVENGWEAYASWLEHLREQVSEERSPLPRELIP